jgi:hypothetical protein
MLNLQYDLQKVLELKRGVPTAPLHMSDEDRVIYIKDMFIALVVELAAEYMNEIRWKPWSSGEHFFNREAAFGEAVDMMHFVINLAMAAAPDGADPSDVARMLFAEYLAKNKENMRRALDGYDAVSDKCPSCRRDLRDLLRHMTPDSLERDGSYRCLCDADITVEVNTIVGVSS